MALAKLGLVDGVEARQAVQHLLTEGACGLKHEGDCTIARGASRFIFLITEEFIDAKLLNNVLQ